MLCKLGARRPPGWKGTAHRDGNSPGLNASEESIVASHAAATLSTGMSAKQVYPLLPQPPKLPTPPPSPASPVPTRLGLDGLSE